MFHQGHYCFSDKTELITHCVRIYKSECVRWYDAVTERATTAGDVQDGFIDALRDTLRNDADMQRLWYDLRVQSLFEPTFREDVAAIDTAIRDMVWRVVTRYAELSGTRPAVSADTAYAAFDGMFSQLVRSIGGDTGAAELIAENVKTLLPRLLESPPEDSANSATSATSATG